MQTGKSQKYSKEQLEGGKEGNLFEFCILYLIIILIYSFSGQTLDFRGPRIFYLVVTIIIQLYCNVHIVLRKWQQYKEENRNIQHGRVSIPIIRIFLNDNPIQASTNERSISEPIPNSVARINNVAYNKVLAEVTHITLFFIYVLFFLTIRAYIGHFISELDTHSIINQSKIKLYILNFAPQFLVTFMFPLMFYFSHIELRIYWKNCFRICRRKQF